MLESIWPQMLSAVLRDSLVMAKRDWRRYSFDDDLLFHCQVAHACGLHLALQKNNSSSEKLEALTLARHYHHLVAIRLLKCWTKESSDQSGWNDQLCTSIATMAIPKVQPRHAALAPSESAVVRQVVVPSAQSSTRSKFDNHMYIERA